MGDYELSESDRVTYLKLGTTRKGDKSPSPNHNKILDYIHNKYLELYNMKLDWDSKEIGQVKKITSKAERVNKENPLDIVKIKVKIFEQYIKQDRNNYWIFSPGSLLSNWNKLVGSRPPHDRGI